MMLTLVFIAEAMSSSSFALLKRPDLGFLFLGAALAVVLGWSKAYRRRLESDAVEWIRDARVALDAGRDREASCKAADAARGAAASSTRNAALKILVWVALVQGKPNAARRILEEIQPRHGVDAYTLAAVENAEGRPKSAISTLERAKQKGSIGREGGRLLIDLYAGLGDFKRVATATRELLNVLEPDDIRLVVRFLEDAGDFRDAAQLSCASAVQDGAA